MKSSLQLQLLSLTATILVLTVFINPLLTPQIREHYHRVSGFPRRHPEQCSSGRCRWHWDASGPEGLWSATGRGHDQSREPPPGLGRSAKHLQSQTQSVHKTKH